MKFSVPFQFFIAVALLLSFNSCVELQERKYSTDSSSSQLGKDSDTSKTSGKSDPGGAFLPVKDYFAMNEKEYNEAKDFNLEPHYSAAKSYNTFFPQSTKDLNSHSKGAIKVVEFEEYSMKKIYDAALAGDTKKSDEMLAAKTAQNSIKRQVYNQFVPAFNSFFTDTEITKRIINKVYVVKEITENNTKKMVKAYPDRELGCVIVVANLDTKEDKTKIALQELNQCFFELVGLSQQDWQATAAAPVTYSAAFAKEYFGVFEEKYLKDVDLVALFPYGVINGTGLTSFLADVSLYWQHLAKEKELAGIYSRGSSFVQRIDLLFNILKRIDAKRASDYEQKMKTELAKLKKPQLLYEQKAGYSLHTMRYPKDWPVAGSLAFRFLSSDLWAVPGKNEFFTNFGRNYHYTKFAEEQGKLKEVGDIYLGKHMYKGLVHQERVYAVTYGAVYSMPTTDPNYFANDLVVFDVNSGKLINSLRTGEKFNEFLMLPNNQLLVSNALKVGNIQRSRLDVYDLNLKKVRGGNVENFTLIDLDGISADGKTVVTNSSVDDTLVYLRSTANLQTQKKLSCQKTGGGNIVSENGKYLISDSGFWFVCIHDMNTLNKLHQVTIGVQADIEDVVKMLSVENGEKTLILVNRDPKSKSFSATNQAEVISIANQTGAILKRTILPWKASSMVMLSSGKIVISGENALLTNVTSQFTEAHIAIFDSGSLL